MHRRVGKLSTDMCLNPTSRTFNLVCMSGARLTRLTSASSRLPSLPPLCATTCVILALFRRGEMTKFAMCVVMLLVSGQWSQALAGWSLADAVSLAGVPALVYTVQNICIQIAYVNLDG